MNCTNCGCATSVIDSRAKEDGAFIGRRRKCDSCQSKFNTLEIPADTGYAYLADAERIKDLEDMLEVAFRGLKREIKHIGLTRVRDA